ncbi:1-hydroxy-2-methyl-2-butenyl 4-diphosphate reductase [Streptomyces sp. SL13]|uniref:1-hydroxy-2-methyl-2-butenyl 4-diphosphate reductase n=1 Tax=Streptantibioticus silvisoli TaxID=2705255 RepID=A0AA90H605_9ACTN|nr:1-hydroxy-2-methyl-2-butenyl 4-diphosphate reductase [Streptantibioticus silvisoli]MDI5968677.1 1-hydroxy-2-methyl-2-butenyl 4-diphosphate reductase [Streptantibioticus silvisoli]
MDPSPGTAPRTRPAEHAGTAAAPGPLLVVCALGVERYALRAADRAGPAVALLRAGMGPRRAGDAVTGALVRDGRPAAAVLVTGFCAGLAPGVLPGDVVVDDRSDAAAVLAAAARHAVTPVAARRPVTVHTGRVAGADHVVRGAERAALAASGALAVDMESEAVRLAALAVGDRPVAAVRVVVDTPQYELLRPATLRNGYTAYRVLRSLVPAFLDWHRSSQLPWR